MISTDGVGDGTAGAAGAPSPTPGTPGPPGEEAGLQASLTALTRLANSRFALEEVLARVAALAVGAIPGADGAGLTLLQQDRGRTVVTTTDLVRQVDDVQYGLGEGPCISAAEQGQTVMSDSIGADARWPHFGGRVARMGLHSVLSLPLVTPDEVIGAINVYARAKQAFDADTAAVAERFAAPAAVVVENAVVLDRTRRLARQLEDVVQTRGSVDRAVGIIISRTGATPEEALARLRRISQAEHLKLSTVADRIVEEAAARARARRVDPEP